MRPSNFLKGFFAFIIVSSALSLMAQQPNINYFRPWDKDGVNVFETPKEEVAPYEGVKVRIGGAFTQQFQALSHENTAAEKLNADGVNLNQLYSLGSGFNLATANLNIDVQLGDGIRLALENYMSSRHHSEFWVKGGYIQFDKLPFLGNPQFFTDYITLKVGHMEVNYGDQHFRRTDNGNSFFNPFVGNTIMDAFATEIGGEAYFKHPSGIVAMVGMTAGLINGNVFDYGDPDPEKGLYTKSPSIYGKLAFDKNISDDFRFRLSASHYRNNNTIRNTLYAGDRTGSRFYLAMENVLASAGSQFTSGRFNPNFRNQISATMINTLVKFKGFELFGLYEMSSGLAGAETDDNRRSFNQFSAELTYRFLSDEQLFVAARYNSAFGQSELKDADGNFIDVSINRIEAALGWYVTKNLLAKVAYVNQEYVDFPTTDIRSGGLFNGFMIEAAVGF